MKKIKLLLLFIGLVIVSLVKSQTSTVTPTPADTAIHEGHLDVVFDQQGRKYNLDDIRVQRINAGTPSTLPMLCSTNTGYFDLYFDPNSGVSGNTPTDIARRNVICQVFADISAFINSPLTSTGQKVNIWIRDINPLLPGYSPFNQHPAVTSGALGLATSFFCVPYNTSSSYKITDNEIWKTIHAGTDSYQNVSLPVFATSGGTFFHGCVALNFENLGFLWHDDMSTPALIGENDLYSIVLHEVTHALGFASLMDSNGGSSFGGNYNYYSRYDLFLRNNAADKNLIVNSGACSLDGYQFNPAVPLTAINPGGCTAPGGTSDHTALGTSVTYVGSTTVPVFTPNCFEASSSLHHFEDEIYINSANNNLYFVMSNQNGTGPLFTKRALMPEERMVLCDLGYSTNNTFGSSVANNITPYVAAACPGVDVAGINDGLNTNGSYIFTGDVGAPTGITINNILLNDHNAVSYECVTVVKGGGTLSSTSGSGPFQYFPNIAGHHLLSYIPVAPNGDKGNITYIYVFATVPPCTGVCDLVANGKFEQYSSLPTTQAQIYKVCGWQDATASGTADHFHANSLVASCQVPCNAFGDQADNAGLLAYAGLEMNSMGAENIYTKLTAPLLAGTNYQLKVDVSLADGWSASAYPIQLYLSSTLPIVAGSFPPIISNPAMLFTSSPAVTNSSGWTTLTFNFTPSGGEQYLTIGNINNLALSANTPASATGCPYANGNFPNYQTAYYFIDNVSLLTATPISVNASASPNIVCALDPVTLSASGSGGSAPITYNWQPINAPGSSVIDNPNTSTTYVLTGTDATGCTATAQTVVNVNPLPVITAVASPPNVCPTSPNSVLTGAPNSGINYIWSTPSGPISGNPITVSPTSNTTYNVFGTDVNGCSNTANVTVTYGTCITPCSNCTNVFGASGSMIANGLANVFCINNDVTVVGTKFLISSEFKIGSNVRIIIPSGATLNIINSHLYSCGNMWQGIEVQNGGKLAITNSLIEDARIAVDVTGNTQTTANVLNFNTSTFNRNDIAINIRGYTQAVTPYPFAINNCVITCRDIQFIQDSRIFPPSSTIGAAATNPGAPFTNSVINNSTYPETTTAAYLKAPFAANTKPTAGIRLTNVGVTQNPQTATPTYFEFKLGGTLTNKNIIDNQRIGVDLMQSNFSTYNTTYQNMVVSNGHGLQGGIGINANSQEVGNFRLQVTSALSLNAATGNKFVDCSRAINSVNYFEHIITYNDIRSSQSNLLVLPNHRGEFGVKSVTNRFRIYNVSSNTLYNVQNGIIMDGTFGPLSIPSIPATGQYAGKINVDNNTIAPQIGTTAVANQYVSNAIALSNIVSSAPVYYANVTFPTLQSVGNTLNKVYRGIAYSTWQKFNSIINSNNIVVINDVFVTNNLQYGIAMSKCAPAVGQNKINSNTVSGYGITNPKLYGIVSNVSPSNMVSCNTVTNTTDGIEFAGGCSGATFTQNTMNTNKYGFVLSGFGGSTGPLGTLTAPTDNRWTGAWPAGVRYKTATINTSAIGNELYVRQVPPFYNPNSSSFTSPGTFFNDDYYWTTGNAGTLKYVTSSPVNLGCPVLATGGGTNPAVSNFIQQLEQIALDQVAYAANQIAQARFINKANLLSMLKADPSLMATSPILQTFTATSVNTSREKFVTIETQAADGNLASAGSINASISPTINVESNHKEFYNTLLNYANKSLTTADSITVVTLSNGCPFTDGSVVYQARALYNVMFDTYQVFLDNCDENTNNSRLIKPKEEEETKDLSSLFDAVIFPNPGTANFNIATFGLTEGNVDVTISDVTGKIVYQNKLQVINALTNFDIDVKSGIYFVKIYDRGINKTLIKKLVVQQ